MTRIGAAGLLFVVCAACTEPRGESNEPLANAGSNGAAASGATPSAGSSAQGGAASAPTTSGGTGGVAGVAVAATGGNGGAPQPIAGATAASEGGSSGATPTPDAGSLEPRLPVVTNVDDDGPFEVTQDLASGPHGASGLFYPTELGRDGLRHPIFVWGCGGTASPSTYASELTRIASHGFVVIAEVSNIGDDDGVLSASLDWILAEDARADSVFFEKLDTTKVAAGGHSIGSVNTFLFADDPRLTTTIHVAGGSLDDVNDPFAATTGMGGAALIHPAAFICSESDVFGNVEKTEKDFANTTVPTFFTVITGAEHIGATNEGLPAIVAWLRWQLGGEDERSPMFLDAAGEFRTGKFVSQIKNW